MTAAELPPVDTQAARDLTDRIKVGVEAVWHLITEAYTSRAWAALGYRNWDDLARSPRSYRVGEIRSIVGALLGMIHERDMEEPSAS